MRLLLLILFSFLVLFLFFLFYCEADIILFLDYNYEKTISYMLEEKFLYCFKANADNDSENVSSNCINMNGACSVSSLKNNISIAYNGLKTDTKLIIYKIKVFDRTLS